MSSSTVLSIGVLDGIVSTSGYTGSPHYTIQSDDANLTTVIVTSALTGSALGMSLRHVQLRVSTPSSNWVLPSASTTSLYTSSQLVLGPGSATTLQLSGAAWSIASDNSAGVQVVVSSSTALLLNVSFAWSVGAALMLQSPASLTVASSAYLSVTGLMTASNASVSGSGTLYLSGSSTWSAGSVVTCAVQLSSGTHTLYDLNLQTWTPSSLVAGQPSLCDYCYTGPTIVITPLSSTPLPTASVSAYLGRLTLYGVQSPALATLSVSSSTVLSIGVLDGIVSTSGYTGSPHYTIQSDDANLTTVIVTSALTGSALGMSLRHVQLRVSTPSSNWVLPSASTTSLYTSSQLVLGPGSATTLQLSGAAWSIASDNSAGVQVVVSSSTALLLNVSFAWSVGAALMLQSPASLTVASSAYLSVTGLMTASNASVSGSGTLYLSGSSTWSAGSVVTCAVQLSSGTHTLYDLNLQTWTPSSLVAGQPSLCDYCYTGPTIVITPLSSTPLPTASVSAYLGRLTLYGVQSPALATLSVSSSTVLSIGVLDGIVSTSGYTGSPHYTIQSDDANLTTVIVTSALTGSALGMSLRHVQLRVSTPSSNWVLPSASTTSLYTSSQLVLGPGSATTLQLSGAAWSIASDNSAGVQVVVSSSTALLLNVSFAWSVGAALMLQSPASLTVASSAYLSVTGLMTASNASVSGSGTLYLSGSSTWSAGSVVTCAVQLSSGTHTLYDLNLQTWTPSSLVAGQPSQCGYCYSGPTLIITPSSSAPLPTASVSAYLGRLTFYGVQSPALATVLVSSSTVLSIGVLDGIVSTSGATGPPQYSIQSADANLTTVLITSSLTGLALGMTLRHVQLQVTAPSIALVLPAAQTTSLFTSSRLLLSGGGAALQVSGSTWTVSSDASASVAVVSDVQSVVMSSSWVVSSSVSLTFSQRVSVLINGSASLQALGGLQSGAGSAVLLASTAASLSVAGSSTFLNASISGLGTMYLFGSTSWSAGSVVTCAVQLSSGTHTLYDLNLQTWTPSSLVAGQPSQCGYCYSGPTLIITPSSSAPLPTASVSAYLGRLTFYGVQSPALATVLVSSSTVLSIGVLDGIVSTSGATGPPQYSIQSADANLTTVLITSSLTGLALGMTLRHVQLQVTAPSIALVLPAAQTTSLFTSSRLLLSGGGAALQVSGSTWTVSSDASASVAVVSDVQSVVMSSSWVVSSSVSLTFSQRVSVLINGSASLQALGGLQSGAGSAVLLASTAASLSVAGSSTFLNASISGLGTMYLFGSTSWSAGSVVTCAVQLSSGTHTLYDLNLQTWTPSSLVAGQPSQCGYCYSGPTLIITPSSSAPLPTASVSAYLGRLTFYGVQSPALATVLVSSSTVLSIGVLDGIVSTSGATGPPQYSIQSADANLTTVLITSSLTGLALGMTLRHVQLQVTAPSIALVLPAAQTTSLFTSSRLLLSGGGAALQVSGSTWTVSSDASASVAVVSDVQSVVMSSSWVVSSSVSLTFSQRVSVLINGSASLQALGGLQSGAGSAVLLASTAASLSVAGSSTFLNASISGLGTMYLFGSTSWSAGSVVTCAVQLSSGTHTLYDLNLQTWTPSSLVAGQPSQCGYCYSGPTLIITPSSSAPLPTASVSAYLGRLTFYGVQSPALATVLVSSSTVLSIGVLDGIVSTSGATGPPQYSIQSADANLTTVLITSSLTGLALGMTLRHVQLQVTAPSIALVLPAAQTTSLFTSSRLLLSGGGAALQVSGSTWTVSSDASASVAVVSDVQSVVMSSSWVVSSSVSLTFSQRVSVLINGSASLQALGGLQSGAGSAVLLASTAASLSVAGSSTFLNASISGLGTMYLFGSTSWSAGSVVTCAVQLSSGTHTLYDLNLQTWTPSSLVAGQPSQCGYCYSGPTLIITPSSSAPLPTASVSAYLGRLTFYGVQSPALATVLVSSSTVLSIGVLDGIVSTSGATGPPQYSIQSADANLTTVLITSSLTGLALGMTLRHVQLQVTAPSIALVLPAAQTTSLFTSSRLLLSGGGAALQVSGSTWTVSSDASASVAVVSDVQSVVMSSSWVVSSSVSLTFSQRVSVLINGSASLQALGGLQSGAGSAVLLASTAASLSVAGSSTFLNASISGLGTMYLFGSTSWSAGSVVTCAVQLSSGTHTLYDLNLQTWTPSSLVAGQPSQCGYCYSGPTLIITPSSSAPLPTASVSAYLGRLTFYGVQSPALATVLVSSSTVLSIGVLDGIVSTSGATGPPQYSIQSADANRSTVVVASLTAAAFSMTLVATRLVLYSAILSGTASAQTLTLRSLSTLIIPSGGVFAVAGSAGSATSLSIPYVAAGNAVQNFGVLQVSGAGSSLSIGTCFLSNGSVSTTALGTTLTLNAPAGACNAAPLLASSSAYQRPAVTAVVVPAAVSVTPQLLSFGASLAVQVTGTALPSTLNSSTLSSCRFSPSLFISAGTVLTIPPSTTAAVFCVVPDVLPVGQYELQLSFDGSTFTAQPASSATRSQAVLTVVASNSSAAAVAVNRVVAAAASTATPFSPGFNAGDVQTISWTSLLSSSSTNSSSPYANASAVYVLLMGITPVYSTNAVGSGSGVGGVSTPITSAVLSVLAGHQSTVAGSFTWVVPDLSPLLAQLAVTVNALYVSVYYQSALQQLPVSLTQSRRRLLQGVTEINPCTAFGANQECQGLCDLGLVSQGCPRPPPPPPPPQPAGPPGGGNGDPHFTTWDGQYYDFMGKGGYWLVQQLNSSSAPHTVAGFSSQIFLAPLQNLSQQVLQTYTGVTYTSSIAVSNRPGQSVLIMQAVVGSPGLAFYVDGLLTNAAVPAQGQSASASSYLFNGGQFFLTSANTATVVMDSGYVVTVNAYENVARMSSFTVTVPQSSFNHTQGLMGSYDGSAYNDFTDASGRNWWLSYPGNFNGAAAACMQTFAVSPSDSYFVYNTMVNVSCTANGSSCSIPAATNALNAVQQPATSTPAPVVTVPAIWPNASLQAAAQAVCTAAVAVGGSSAAALSASLYQGCLLDVYVTNSTAQAAPTAQLLQSVQLLSLPLPLLRLLNSTANSSSLTPSTALLQLDLSPLSSTCSAFIYLAIPAQATSLLVGNASVCVPLLQLQPTSTGSAVWSDLSLSPLSSTLYQATFSSAPATGAVSFSARGGVAYFSSAAQLQSQLMYVTFLLEGSSAPSSSTASAFPSVTSTFSPQPSSSISSSLSMSSSRLSPSSSLSSSVSSSVLSSSAVSSSPASSSPLSSLVSSSVGSSSLFSSSPLSTSQSSSSSSSSSASACLSAAQYGPFTISSLTNLALPMKYLWNDPANSYADVATHIPLLAGGGSLTFTDAVDSSSSAWCWSPGNCNGPQGSTFSLQAIGVPPTGWPGSTGSLPIESLVYRMATTVATSSTSLTEYQLVFTSSTLTRTLVLPADLPANTTLWLADLEWGSSDDSGAVHVNISYNSVTSGMWDTPVLVHSHPLLVSLVVGRRQLLSRQLLPHQLFPCHFLCCQLHPFQLLPPVLFPAVVQRGQQQWTQQQRTEQQPRLVQPQQLSAVVLCLEQQQ